MDPRHLKLYNEELYFIREMGRVFAASNPEVASRLALNLSENKICPDPYVERLLEGFAFLTSRIQLKYQEEFPEFTQHLLDIVYPDFLTQLPSMTIIQFNPDAQQVKQDGVIVNRGTRLLSPRISDKRVQCEFHTAHSVQLWPLEISEAKYGFPGDLPDTIKKALHPDVFDATKGVIRLKLQTSNGELSFRSLTGLDNLDIHLVGSGGKSRQIYEILLSNCHKVLVVGQGQSVFPLPEGSLRPLGYDDESALLPVTTQSFSGYRLLQEYFALPERFMFVSLTHLQEAFKHCNTSSVEIFFMLNKLDEQILRTLGAEHFKLFCTPAINLFEKTADRVHLTKQAHNIKANRRVNSKGITHYLPGFPVVMEKTAPLHYEIYRILDVKGVGNFQQKDIQFYPFYSLDHNALAQENRNFYTLQRVPEIRLTDKENTYQEYQGTDIYISLSSDESNLPYPTDINELKVRALCTNRGIPLYFGMKNVDFTTPDDSLPVLSQGGIRNIIAFTSPRPPHLPSEHTWRLINLLSLNYLSIADEHDPEKNTQALRELLHLQISNRQANGIRENTSAIDTQINRGLHRVESSSIIHPVYSHGKISYARGIQINVTLREDAFGDGGAFLFGSLLERFFSGYASINSFTQTLIHTIERGEIMQWPIRMGNKITL